MEQEYASKRLLFLSHADFLSWKTRSVSLFAKLMNYFLLRKNIPEKSC